MTGISIASVVALLVINASIKGNNVMASMEDAEDRFLGKTEMDEEDVSLSTMDGKQIIRTPELGLVLDDVISLCPQLYGASDRYLFKRNFNPWGGKRSAQTALHHQSANMNKKGGTFNPWGGKRDAINNSPTQSKNDPLTRRTPFNPWGGRR